MKLRAPAYPLISVDPYFNVWCMGNRLNADNTRHWTGKPCSLTGIANVDGTDYCFIGNANLLKLPELRQTGIELDTFSTVYTFASAGIRLTAEFTSPLLPDDNELLSRPVSYLNIVVSSADGKEHTVLIKIHASEEFCLDRRGQMPVSTRVVNAADGIATIGIGSLGQPVLGRSGDDVRIDWGYFYLSADGDSRVYECREDSMVCVGSESRLNTSANTSVLITFAYDDIDSIQYFHEPLKAYWKKDGQTIFEAIACAYRDYDGIIARCQQFGGQLNRDAEAAGGEEYAELLTLALRQVLAAHKLVVDSNGEILYISKECFSNGCAATVDVSYPSIPLFLLYNPELIKGMMRPIFRYAAGGVWPYDFAPHDCGTYPLLNGQVYSNGTDIAYQMPVEECGNMLLMAAAIASVEKNASFAARYRPLLGKWAEYLLRNGLNPENQLCTDDFAGHLAHNCNLSLKAITALCGYAHVCRMLGDPASAERYLSAARSMAGEWVKQAANGDGSYRLAFDRPGTFSMKYNMVWDKLFGLNLFPATVRASEVHSYFAHLNPYGLPLDNRADYTKSDWLVWTATLADSKEQFQKLVHPLWLAYHLSPSRVPMTDWYSTVTSMQCGFQNRTVQGGLFIKVLEQKELCRF